MTDVAGHINSFIKTETSIDQAQKLHDILGKQKNVNQLVTTAIGFYFSLMMLLEVAANFCNAMPCVLCIGFVSYVKNLDEWHIMRKCS